MKTILHDDQIFAVDPKFLGLYPDTLFARFSRAWNTLKWWFFRAIAWATPRGFLETKDQRAHRYIRDPREWLDIEFEAAEARPFRYFLLSLKGFNPLLYVPHAPIRPFAPWDRNGKMSVVFQSNPLKEI